MNDAARAPWCALVSAETVTAWAERAFEALSWRSDDDDDDAWDRLRRRDDGARHLLRFCLLAIGLLRDPELRALAQRIIALNPHDDTDPCDTLLVGLRLLAEDGPEVPWAESIATNREEWARQALAQGLSPDGPVGRQTLETLARDPVPTINLDARGQLKSVMEVPAWWGRLSRAPEALVGRALTETEAAAVNDYLTKLGAVRWFSASIDPLIEALGPMPDAVALDAAMTLLRALGGYSRSAPTVLRAAAGRAGFGARIVEALGEPAVGRTNPRGIVHGLGPVLQALPSIAREALCETWRDALLGLADDAWTAYDGVAALLCGLLAETWTDALGGGALLDLALALDAATGPLGRRDLSALVARIEAFAAKDDALTERLVWHWADGDDALPGRLAEVAVRLLDARDTRARAEAAARLIGARAKDPRLWAIQQLWRTHDGTSEASVEAVLATEEGIALVAGDRDLCAMALPAMRRRLAQGALDVETAADVMVTIDLVFGGLAERNAPAPGPLGDVPTYRARLAENRLEQREALRAKCAGWLRPGDAPTPITADEWRQWRALRDRAIEEAPTEFSMVEVVSLLPDGPIVDADRAAVARCIARSDAPPIEHVLRVSLTEHPSEMLLPWLDACAQRADDARGAASAWQARRYVRAALGLDPWEGDPSERPREKREEPAEARLTAEERDALIATGEAMAGENYGGYDDPLPREQQRRRNLGWSAGVQALALAVREAGMAGDAEMLPWVVQTLTHKDDARAERPEMASAAEAALKRLIPAADDLSCLGAVLRSSDPGLRAAMAEGLVPEREADRELLEALLADRIPWVARRARDKLTAVTGVAWWAGRFPRDPLRGASEAEAEALRGPLEAICEILGDGKALRRDTEALRGHIEALPDDLALELAEHLMRPGGDVFGLSATAWRAVRERAGSESLLVRVLRRSNDDTDGLHRVYYGLKSAMAGMSPEADARISAALLKAIDESPRRAWGDFDSLPATCAELLRMTFPEGGDYGPVLALMHRDGGAPKHGGGAWFALSEIAKLEWVDLGAAAQEAAVALEGGCPGTWENLRSLAETLVRALDDEALRELAERCVMGAHEASKRWAIEALLGPLFDPERDGTRHERALAYWREPRWREALTARSEHRDLVLGARRLALRAGELEVTEIPEVLSDIHRAFGGMSTIDPSEFVGASEASVEALRAQAEREPSRPAPMPGGAALEEGDVSGPPTPEEWAIWRSARAARMSRPKALGARRLRREVLQTLPEGPIADEDDGVFRAVMAHWRDEDDAYVELLSGLTQHPGERALSMLDAMHGEAPDATIDDYARWARRMMRARLGLDPKDGEAALRRFEEVPWEEGDEDEDEDE